MGRYARSRRINPFRRPHSSYACPACKLRVLPSCVVGSFVFLVRAFVVSGAVEAYEGGRGRAATPPRRRCEADQPASTAWLAI